MQYHQRCSNQSLLRVCIIKILFVSLGMKYLIEGIQYHLSYTELRDKYREMRELSDEEFLDKIPEAMHLACVICYLKETPLQHCLSDMGVIHELAHLIHIKEDTIADLPRIRATFDHVLELC